MLFWGILLTCIDVFLFSLNFDCYIRTLCMKTNMCICVQLEGHSHKFTRAIKRTIMAEVVEKNETHFMPNSLYP